MTRNAERQAMISDPERLLAIHLGELGVFFEREYRFDADCCEHRARDHRYVGPQRRFCVQCAGRYGYGYHLYTPSRRWRVDFYLPSPSIAIEVEGGGWIGGRHTRGKGFAADIEKYNALTLAGIRLLRVTPQMVEDGRAKALVQQAMARLVP